MSAPVVKSADRVSTGVRAISENAANRIPPDAAPGERFTSFTLTPGVSVTVQSAAKSGTQTTTPQHLIVYLLPNGNTTQQALGRSASPGLDWHYAIQHIAAQTRRVRELLATRAVATVVVEADTLSWPAWRRLTPGANERIRQMLDEILLRAGGSHTTVDLIAHSGGGSFIFGLLNSADALPDYVRRIVFIDANYSYDDADRHGDKLLAWLRDNDSHRLVVLCYDDRRITVGGKPVVSDTGGTWRATGRMARRLENDVTFTSGTMNDLHTSTAMNGQILLARHPNPENKILHTVLVEKNGFVYGAAEGRAELKPGDIPFADTEEYRRLVLP